MVEVCSNVTDIFQTCFEIVKAKRTFEFRLSMGAVRRRWVTSDTGNELNLGKNL